MQLLKYHSDYLKGITVICFILPLAIGYAAQAADTQPLPYPADNDADYYDRSYHTPVTPVVPQYMYQQQQQPVQQQPAQQAYPSDNDSDYYYNYYGDDSDTQYVPPTPNGTQQQQQAPAQYPGYDQYYYNNDGYPQDNDETYYKDPTFYPQNRAVPTVNMYD